MSENNDKKPEENGQTPETEGKQNFTFLYVAIGCLVVSCIALSLAFVINGAGVYMLIASMVCSLAAMSFLNAQKRRAFNTLCKVIQILSYVIMIADVAIFVIGASIAGTQKQ